MGEIPKTILVTGCAGFIGGNFSRVFSSKFPKTKIVGIDDLSSGRLEAIAKGVIFYKGSITEIKLLDKIFKKHKPEYIFHFAAIAKGVYSIKHPYETTNVNSGGTAALLEKSRDYGVKRFIFSASSSVYGNAKKMPVSEKTPAKPLSPYAMQKYISELLCAMHSELYGLDTVSLRYFNVYGPGQYGDSAYANVISAWLESMFSLVKKKPFLEGDGSQSRDFCFVEDVVNANILAMQSPHKFKGGAINISLGSRITLIEIKKLIEKYTNKSLNLEKRPSRIGDIRHSHADITKAKKILRYKPTVSFESGLKKTIEWFKKRRQ